MSVTSRRQPRLRGLYCSSSLNQPNRRDNRREMVPSHLSLKCFSAGHSFRFRQSHPLAWVGRRQAKWTAARKRLTRTSQKSSLLDLFPRAVGQRRHGLSVCTTDSVARNYVILRRLAEIKCAFAGSWQRNHHDQQKRTLPKSGRKKR